MRSQVRLTIHRLRSTGQCTRRKDRVTVEAPLAMRLAWSQGPAIPLNVTMRTPGDDFALTAGFLYAEGIIQSADELGQLTHCVDTSQEDQHHNVVQIALAPGVSFDPASLQRHFVATSSCGVCGKASIDALVELGHPPLPQGSPLIDPAILFKLEDDLLHAQDVFTQTGGLHAAALFDQHGERLALREDVGRHNALDKLIGQQLLADALPLSKHIAMVSGRLSFELVQKAIRAGIPIMAAVGAPSSLAIELAESAGMTLIGFLREDRCNVYTGLERLAVSD